MYIYIYIYIYILIAQGGGGPLKKAGGSTCTRVVKGRLFNCTAIPTQRPVLAHDLGCARGDPPTLCNSYREVMAPHRPRLFVPLFLPG